MYVYIAPLCKTLALETTALVYEREAYKYQCCCFPPIDSFLKVTSLIFSSNDLEVLS